jgi:hypothetical protein
MKSLEDFLNTLGIDQHLIEILKLAGLNDIKDLLKFNGDFVSDIENPNTRRNICACIH